MKKILNIAICFGLGYFAAMVTLPPVEKFEKTRCLVALEEDDKGNTIILDYETYKSFMEEMEFFEYIEEETGGQIDEIGIHGGKVIEK